MSLLIRCVLPTLYPATLFLQYVGQLIAKIGLTNMGQHLCYMSNSLNHVIS